jgi:hypothetical protein
MSNALIISHGDLDGVVSAVMINQIIKSDYDNIEVVWSQPYWIADPKYTGDLSEYDYIYIADIALNNRNIGTVMNFIQKYKGRITWYDHHFGWSKYNIYQTVQFKLYVDERAKSCVEVIRKVHPKVQYTEKINGLIKLAHETDQGIIDNLFHKALKINPKNNESRYEIFRYGTSLNGGELERQSLVSLKVKATKYSSVMLPNTETVLKEDSKKKDGVLFIDIRNRKRFPIDKTLLFFQAYRSGCPHVVLRFNSKSNEECLTVATKTNINLVKRFKLPSGQAYRITLFKPKLTDAQISKLLK